MLGGSLVAHLMAMVLWVVGLIAALWVYVANFASDLDVARAMRQVKRLMRAVWKPRRRHIGD